jgi:signal transduction histidine kinase
MLGMAASAEAFEWLPLPYRIESTMNVGYSPNISSLSVHGFTPDSATGDLVFNVVTDKDAMLGQPRTRILIYDGKQTLLEQLNSSALSVFAYGRDIDGDGKSELLLVERTDSTNTLNVLAWPSRDTLSQFIVKAGDYPERKLGKWDTQIQVGPTINGVLKNRSALLLSVFNGFGIVPRELALLDPQTGEAIWRYRTAFNIVNIDTMDINGDSVPEVIFSTSAGSNGAKWQDMRDDHSYLGALNLAGERIWLKEFPGPYSSVKFSPLPTRIGSPPSLFVAFFGNSSEAGQNRLMRVDARDGKVLAEKEMMGWYGGGMEPWGVDDSGKQQFVISNPSNGVRIYDENLKLVGDTRDVNHGISVGDVDGDGINELIGAKGENETIVLGHHFKKLASAPLALPGNVVLQRNSENRFSYIWMVSDDGVYRLELKRNSKYIRALISWIILVILVPVVLILGRMFWVSRVKIPNLRIRAERERFEAWRAMASKLAHDLRTPLSVMRLTAQNLEQELEAKYHHVPEEFKQYFQTLTEEADRLSEVSRSFLKFTRQAPPILEPTNLEELLRKSVERRPRPAGVNVSIEIQPELPQIRVDSQQIITLIDNLLSNSYRAMKEGGNLTVRLRREQGLHEKTLTGLAASSRQRSRSGDWMIMEIEDTGCGISAEDLPKVFDPYFSRLEGGTGLGLAIVKKIVEDHGGTIRVTSAVGVGTTVSVWLPV